MKRLSLAWICLFYLNHFSVGQITFLPPTGLEKPCFHVSDDVYFSVPHHSYMRFISNIAGDTLIAQRPTVYLIDTIFLGSLTKPGLYQLNAYYSEPAKEPEERIFFYCNSLDTQRECKAVLPLSRRGISPTVMAPLDTQFYSIRDSIYRYLRDSAASLTNKMNAIAPNIIGILDTDQVVSAVFFITLDKPFCLTVTDKYTTEGRSKEYLIRVFKTLFSDAIAKQLQGWINSVTADAAAKRTFATLKDPYVIPGLLNADELLQKTPDEVEKSVWPGSSYISVQIGSAPLKQLIVTLYFVRT